MTTANNITSNFQGAETLTYATIGNIVTGRNDWATTETTYYIAIPKPTLETTSKANSDTDSETTSETNSETTSKTNSDTTSKTTSKTNSHTDSDTTSKTNSHTDSTLSSSSFTNYIATAPTCEPETSNITVTNSNGNVVTEPCESKTPSTSKEADLTSTITFTGSDGKVTQTTTTPFVTDSVPPLYPISEVSSGSTTTNLVYYSSTRYANSSSLGSAATYPVSNISSHSITTLAPSSNGLSTIVQSEASEAPSNTNTGSVIEYEGSGASVKFSGTLSAFIGIMMFAIFD